MFKLFYFRVDNDPSCECLLFINLIKDKDVVQTYECLQCRDLLQ